MNTRRMAIIERARTHQLYAQFIGLLLCIDHRSIHHRTARPVSAPDLDQRRNCTLTLGYAKSAARLESAARGHRVQRRDRAFDRSQRAATLRLQIWHSA